MRQICCNLWCQYVQDRGLRMKLATGVLALSMVVVSTGFALAAECKLTKVATGPTGISKTVCLDGRYSTCMRDGQSVGWSYAQAKTFCDERKRLGKIR